MAAVSAREFAQFNGLLASAVERGLSVERAFQVLQEHARAARFRDAVGGTGEALREGAPLPEAMGRYPDVFPESYRALIEAGLKSDRLAPVLRRAQSYHALRAELRRSMRRLLVYLGTGALLCVIVLAVATYASRYFAQIFTEMGIHELPLVTVIALKLSKSAFLLPLILAGTAAILLVGLRIFRSAFSQSRLGYWVPAWGRLQKSRDLSLFCTSMALSLDCGMPLPECLSRSASAIPNSFGRCVVLEALRRVEDGTDLSTAMFYDRYFPRTLAWSVSMAEARSELPETFLMFADLYAADLKRNFEVLFMILTPLGIFALGNVVLFLIVAMLLPIFQIQMALNA